MIFFGIFKRGQPLADHFVRVEAHDWVSACEILDHMYGLNWRACLYEYEAEALGERSEVRFGTTNTELIS